MCRGNEGPGHATAEHVVGVHPPGPPHWALHIALVPFSGCRGRGGGGCYPCISRRALLFSTWRPDRWLHMERQALCLQRPCTGGPKEAFPSVCRPTAVLGHGARHPYALTHQVSPPLPGSSCPGWYLHTSPPPHQHIASSRESAKHKRHHEILQQTDTPPQTSPNGLEITSVQKRPKAAPK